MPTRGMDIYGDLPPDSVLPASSAPAGSGEGSSTSAPAPVTLDQELDALVSSFNNVGATLGNFWGSVRKQGETAIAASRRELEALNEAAKKDFAKARDDIAPLVSKARDDIAPYMDRARAELTKLGEQAKNSAAAGQAAATGGASIESEQAGDASGESSTTSSSGTARDASEAATQPSSAAGDGISFYGEVMTSPNSGTAPLPPTDAPPQINSLLNAMHSLQAQIQANPSVAQLSRKMPNLSQIQSHISHLQARLPDQVAKSEAYLQRATKDLSDLLNNAVRVVPPSEEELAALRSAGKTPVLSRKEALYHRLRTEAAVMLVDPAQPPPSPAPATTDAATPKIGDDFKASLDSREEYAKFLQSIEDHGGLESEAWQKRISNELALPNGEGAALSASLASLVPEKITTEAFWTRYFFRAHQIDQDEARRRQVLEGASQHNEDEFSWDLEEEEGGEGQSAVAPAAPASTEASPSLVTVPSIRHDSGRTSSEDGAPLSTSSYDMVSRKASEDERSTKQHAAEDEDSDWE